LIFVHYKHKIAKCLWVKAFASLDVESKTLRKKFVYEFDIDSQMHYDVFALESVEKELISS